MKRFLTITFFSLSLVYGHSFASVSNDFMVWVRTDKGKLVQEKRQIDGLINAEFAETEHFKVVEGRSDTPVKLDGSKLAEKAANVLYHLQIAYKYFSEHLGSVNLQKKTIARIEMKDTFYSEFQWGHKKFSKNFNNAVTIPPSDKTKAAGVKSWDNEIWFRPPKEIKKKSDVETMGKLMNNPSYKSNVRSTYIERAAVTVGNQVLSNSTAYLNYELGYLLSMLSFVEVLPTVFKLIGKTHKKKLELDTAMIPEVIYHEFSHVALYDYLNFDAKTPVVEGIANYFAAKMINYHKIGFKAKKFSRGYGGYNGKSKKKYDYKNEAKKYSHSSFLLTLLWSVDSEVEDFDKTVFASRKYLTKDSDIKYDFVDAIEKAHGDIDSSPVARLKIRRLINKHFYSTK